MYVKDFLRTYAIDDERFRRFNEFDSDRFDYTLQFRKPDGEVITLRNPAEGPDGSLTDKGYWIPDGWILLAAGTAGWEWPPQLMHWLGIDFDTNDNHAAGLTAATFEAALEAVRRVPWLEARWSSGGKGLHVFPRLARPIEVKSRSEASALARAVITLASREAGFDFKAAKDCAGGNMWIYKPDAAPNAYLVIKEATAALDPGDLPAGWREAKEAGKRKVSFAPSTVELTPEHLEIEKQLQALGYSLIYNDRYGCYHVHTFALQEAFQLHGYKGYFATVSTGTDPGQPNGYMFPLPGGAFLVKRFGNAKEDTSWFDGANGQYAYLNVEWPFERALEHFAINETAHGYAFDCVNLATMLKVSGVALDVPAEFAGRTLFVNSTKTRNFISVEKHDSDANIQGWTATGKSWQKSFPKPRLAEAFIEAAMLRVSDVIRAVSTDTESAKWCIKTDGAWTGTVAKEVSNVLVSLGEKPVATMGYMRRKPYQLVFEPFQPEYLSKRCWNREAPQLACAPAEEAGDTPIWDAVFEHLGSGLDDDIAADEVCLSRGITSGAQYLKLWLKLLIEKPQQRTPYLFLTSRQNNTGKTSLGASICHLINPGVAEINEEALIDKFTGEFEGKVLCLIEELDLRDKRNKAYATLKRVLTSKTLTIRRMRTDAYNVPNFTHFIHTANDANFVPCETEDMRIVMIDVPPITNLIDSIEFEEGIKREAPAMLRKLMDLALPEPCGRFWLPVVQTSLKESVLSGDYDTDTSEAEEGLKRFADACLEVDMKSMTPTKEVLSRYSKFCTEENLPRVPKPGFLKALREKAHVAGNKKQKRVGSKRIWYYTGFNLKA